MAKNIKLGSVLKGKGKFDNGDPKGDYIQLDDKVTLLYEGKPISAKFINLQNPHTLPRTLLEKKIITEEVAAEMANKAAKRDFVRFDLTVKSEA
jgi:hypothetical protein